MTRPNIALLSGWYTVVGGVGRTGWPHLDAMALDGELRAELIDSTPVFAHETTYFRFRVPGMGFAMLVPIENIRESVGP